MTFKTISDRAADIQDALSRLVFTDHTTVLRRGLDATPNATLLVRDAEEAAAYGGVPCTIAIHDGPSVLAGIKGPIAITVKYAAWLLYEAARHAAFEATIAAPLRDANSRLEGTVRAKDAMVTSLTALHATAQQEQDAAILARNTARDALAMAQHQLAVTTEERNQYALRVRELEDARQQAQAVQAVEEGADEAPAPTPKRPRAKKNTKD